LDWDWGAISRTKVKLAAVSAEGEAISKSKARGGGIFVSPSDALPYFFFLSFFISLSPSV
jgi:hypothetical protein